MLKGEKIAIAAFVLYAASGYIYEMIEGLRLPFYRFNPKTDVLVYWLSIRAAAALALTSFYYYLREQYVVLGYISVSYGVTHLINEAVYQFLYYGESENDSFALVAVVFIVLGMLWLKRKKS